MARTALFAGPGQGGPSGLEPQSLHNRQNRGQFLPIHGNIHDGEFPDCAEAYPPDDIIPATLEPLLAHIFQGRRAELLAAAAHFNSWVADNSELPSGHIASLSQDHKVHPSLGEISYQLRGCTVRRTCAPQTLWHFDKAAAYARALSGDARTQFNALVRHTGGEQVIAIILARPLKRENYVVVLA